MKAANEVGIIGYGVYIPRYVLSSQEVVRVWPKLIERIRSKRVAYIDEDSVTIAYEAARSALRMSRLDPKEIGAVFVGTESKPYAVKPSGTILAEALGITPKVLAADYEFACKAGTEAIQTVIGLVSSGMIKAGLAIGVDVAQGRPGDELEMTAAAGGAAYVLSRKSSETIAFIEASTSYVTDTTDFWRRDGEKYPRHLSRFTGEQAYFKHIKGSVKLLLDETGLEPKDFNYAVFHQPNAKFPVRVAKELGFNVDQIERGLLSNETGNFYSGSALVGLARILDVANPGERILLASFGSGAGSDAFSIVVQDAILEKRETSQVDKFLKRRVEISYSEYVRFMGKLR